MQLLFVSYEGKQNGKFKRRGIKRGRIPPCYPPELATQVLPSCFDRGFSFVMFHFHRLEKIPPQLENQETQPFGAPGWAGVSVL